MLNDVYLQFFLKLTCTQQRVSNKGLGPAYLKELPELYDMGYKWSNILMDENDACLINSLTLLLTFGNYQSMENISYMIIKWDDWLVRMWVIVRITHFFSSAINWLESPDLKIMSLLSFQSLIYR